MTALVAVSNRGRVWLGGDSAATIGDDQEVTLADSKVWISGEWALGAAGSNLYCDVLRHHTELPKLPELGTGEEAVRALFPMMFRKALTEQWADDTIEESEAIVGLRGRLYYIDGALSVTRITWPFVAAGVGLLTAFGALHATRNMKIPPERRVRNVLETCAASCVGVRRPFRVVSV